MHRLIKFAKKAMICVRCQSSENVKNGIVGGSQRYKCKQCGFNFKANPKPKSKPDEMKRLALLMYLEGLGFRSIGRILGVSHVSVFVWVKKFGQQVCSIRNDKPVQVMELDELHTYVGHKKTTVGFGLALVETTDSTLISLLGTEVM